MNVKASSSPTASHATRTDLPRRQLLWSAARLATLAAPASLLGVRAALAQTTDADTTPTPTNRLIWRALSRVGYGPSPALLAAIQTEASPQDWAVKQIGLAHAASQRPPIIAPDLADFNASLPQLADGARREREWRLKVKDSPSAQDNKLPAVDAAALRRMDTTVANTPETFSLRLTMQTAAWRLSSCSLPELEHPLLARMTEFWFNHLNVFIGKGAVRPFVGHYLIHAIRAHALGQFEDLLLASARHPAMLLYLDQAQSVADGTPSAQGQARGLNENYARELMELHTLGVNGGYRQTDVRELARVLTGWTVTPKDESGFRFAPRLHDTGSKQVLGHTFPANAQSAGEAEGVAAIRLLARHPATAQRISLRLAQFFVADTPPPALVQQLSQTFLATQGDISAVLATLLRSADFWAPDNRLFKTPMDFACSALTTTQSAAAADRRSLVLAAAYLAGAGQPLHGWPTPDGYAFDAATWLAPEALTRRADFAMGLARAQPQLDYLMPFMSTSTQATIAQERPLLRGGLLLASPDFMYK
ncbi:DUF1800 domain-containing protein [Rhodoferax sp.]|uniref:DUF1800 domain-containing protein n=1 Tax=Rhodoferax sp. TaxID=50421 RepID=UPI002638C12C|nr:DUF1800 domain-containing protein [Rhodoferax sp.]MDD2925696.1 DUF1800 domain-containing protein [Rhodoferax sp.]